MIIGILIKNYKTYYGLKYTPVSTNQYFTSYIGNNGVGKSSILEALDSYFNMRRWNINNVSKSRGRTGANIPHITVISLINKEKISQKNSKDKVNYEILTKLSDYLWSLDDKHYNDEAKKLIYDIKKINIQYQETHLLSISGIRYDHGNEIFFSSFDKKIMEVFKINNEKEFREHFVSYNEYIKNYYSYIYIPVEVGIEEFTQLETSDMQKLMGKNINQEISKAIGTQNLLSINNNLNKFIKTIEKELSIYTYKNISGRTNISMNELTNKVIELFFSIRTLHKKSSTKDIPVDDLSSGEKRQALIDIAETFIKTQEEHNKEIILAIDEPEASLNISKNFMQFEKLINLSKSNIQVLLTTHWYGFLPIVNNGIAHFLNLTKETIDISSFDLYNYREKLKQIKVNNYKLMPDDITLKSLNDLIQSILSSVKLDKPYNWLICEGSSEKIYFDYYFEDLINQNNLRILPVGGASEVKKLYEYLELPLRDKEDKIKGKIYCLIDTDNQSLEFKTSNHKNLIANRLLNKKDKTILVKTDNNEYSPSTEIEDCLDGNMFIKTLQSFNNNEITKLLDDKQNIKNEKLNSYFCFNLRQDDKEIIKKFFDQDEGYRKIEFAKKYVELSKKNNHKLEWIENIKKTFEDSK